MYYTRLTYKYIITMSMHIFYTFIRVLKHKVNSVALGHTLALDSVVIVVFVEGTFNKFRAVMSHIIHPLFYTVYFFSDFVVLPSQGIVRLVSPQALKYMHPMQGCSGCPISLTPFLNVAPRLRRSCKLPSCTPGFSVYCYFSA